MNPFSRASVRLRRAGGLVCTALVASAVVLASPAGVPTSGPGADPGVGAADLRPVADVSQPRGTTAFQLASFNLLGAGHTDKKNGRKGFAWSDKRLDITKRIIDARGVDVVGFQEMHLPQAQKWVKDRSADWGTFPGTSRSRDAGRASLTWKKQTFTAVRRETIMIPYFGGQELPMPYVLLKHRATGQEAWFLNVHNPADVGGNQKKWRTEALRREAALINRLRKESPAVPVFMTGDMNDREQFYCPMVRQAPMISSNGGYRTTKDGCRPPSSMGVDWVMSTRDNSFTSHTAVRDAQVQRASDHPFVYANANIAAPRMRAAAYDRVVVVAAGGLGGGSLASAPKPATRNLRVLMREGASTTSARTAPESAMAGPNLVTMLTGRRVDKANGGHGVTGNGDDGGTVHASAGRYASSVFDLAHNHGMRTAFYSGSPRGAFVRRSWDAAHGGADPYGPDNGRDKIDVEPVLTGDQAVTDRVVADLKSSPARLTVVELSGLSAASAKNPVGSAGHTKALRALDARIGAIAGTVASTPALGRTLVVVAGTTGDKSGSTATQRRRSAQQVPLIVRGPGVARNAGLYAINPASRFEATAPGKYDGSGPIMVGATANLALAALLLPPIPGSHVNTNQSLNVFPLG